jgi:hypothetical protein
LVDFVGEKLHNLELLIEEEKIGRNAKGDLEKLEKELIEVKTVFQNLGRIRDVMMKNRAEREKAHPKRELKFDLTLIQEKRGDNVDELCKSKSIMLSTYEGFVRLRQQVLETHMRYNFDLDEEDLAF